MLNDSYEWRSRIALATRYAFVGVVSLAVLWYARLLAFLLFGGLLLALCLDSLASDIAKRTHLPRRVALLVVFGVSAGLLVSLIWWRGPAVVDQLQQLQERLPAAFAALAARLSAYPITEINRALAASMLSMAQRAVSSTTGFAVGAGIIIFVGVYVAVEPALYIDGALSLVPEARRPFARSLLRRIAHSLRWWLVAKAVSMVAVGALVAGGLLLFDIPLAGTFGVLAGLLTFIPNVGPILSAIPPLVLALAISPERALSVAGVFVCVHIMEGLAITPLIERRAVRLPPALTLAVQLVSATLVGPIGVALAAPLTAVGLLLVSSREPPGSGVGLSPTRAAPIPDSIARRPR